jgi:hypothetical protein
MPSHRRSQLTAGLATLVAGLMVLFLAPVPVLAHEGDHGHDEKHAADAMVTAATSFWNALTTEQQAKAGFEFKDEERLNWHFVPRARKGLPLKEMTPAQRHLAHAFLSSGLGQRGYTSAVTIMSLDAILKELEEGGRGPVRDSELYFFSVFGKPGGDQTWGWRVEGHHLALNFTIVNGKAVAGAPTFMGTNPAEVRGGPRKGLRVLDREEDLGRAFVKSLNEEQRKKAIFSDKAPSDIITGNQRKAQLDKPDQGIINAELTKDQQAALWQLITVYAEWHRPELAQEDLKRVEAAGTNKIRFAWAGGLEAGVGQYYRIHGPTFLIEYDNTQNNANHIHTVWRDLQDDFGEDLLRKHYDQDAHKPEGARGEK